MKKSCLFLALCLFVFIHAVYAADIRNFSISVRGMDLRTNEEATVRVHFEIYGKFPVSQRAYQLIDQGRGSLAIQYQVEIWEDIHWGRDKKLTLAGIGRTFKHTTVAVDRQQLNMACVFDRQFNISGSELGVGKHNIYAIVTVRCVPQGQANWTYVTDEDGRESSRSYIQVSR